MPEVGLRAFDSIGNVPYWCGGVTWMAAGIPATPLLCTRKTRPFGLVVCESDAVAGIEIIPLEPDQCSDLRREAPSVTLTFPPSGGRYRNY